MFILSDSLKTAQATKEKMSVEINGYLLLNGTLSKENYQKNIVPFYHIPFCDFDIKTVVFDSSLRLYNDRWTIDAIHFLFEHFESLEEIVINFHPNASKYGYVNSNFIKGHIKNYKDTNSSLILNRTSLRGRPTTSLKNLRQLALSYLLTHIKDPDLKLYSELRSNYENLNSFLISGKVTDTINALNEFYYFVGGASFKAPLIKYIIRNYFKKRTGKFFRKRTLNLLDFGCGLGTIGNELTTDEDLFVNASGLEPFGNYNLIFEFATSFLSLDSNLLRIPAEDFDDQAFSDELHIASFIGSLLYVDREKVRNLLDTVWRKLEIGGILIIHENIKNPKFTADYKYMFTVTELEEILSKYGDIRYFSSTYEGEVSPDKIGEKTLFRVICKQ